MPALIITIISFIIQLFDPILKPLLRFEIITIQQGQLWRIWTAHFTHLNWQHYIINMLTFWIIWFLLGHYLAKIKFFYLQLLFFITGILLFYLHPELSWYVGFSGVLHGFISLGALLALFDKSYGIGGILLVYIVVKLIYEQIIGPLPTGSMVMHTDNILVDAHLYGGFAGLLVFGFRVLSKAS